MTDNSRWTQRLGCTGLVTGLLVTVLSAPVLAEPPGRNYDRDDRQESRDERRDRDQRRDYRDERREQRDDRHDRNADRERRGERRERNVRHDYRYRADGRDRRYSPPGYRQPGYDIMPWERSYPRENRFKDRYRSPVIVRHGRRHVVPPERVRRYRDVVIVRPFGHWYPGYAHYHRDDDAYKWLAFTAITLGLLDYLNEAQQREHEAAQIAATTAPIGERIYWREGGAGGYVVATRDGTSASGRYCREFQQEVTIGGRAEQAYGTACLNPDGSWEVVSAEGY
jgi:hypothetical protein